MFIGLPEMIAAAIISGYIFTSIILFKYPSLIHRSKRLKFECRHISHRGGAGENLENTIAAYEHAVNKGTQMLEIDLQMTKDEQVVICHDDDLFRVTGQRVKISELDFSELPSLKPALAVDFAGGVMCEGNNDFRIPLLREVYEKFPNLPINIDIKTNNDILIEKVSDLTRQFSREEITIWGNASDEVTQKCFKENPNMPLLFSFKRVFVLLLCTYTGLLPFIPFKESCLEIPFPTSIRRNPVYKEYSNRSRKAILWVLEKLLVRRALFAHLKKRGIQTYVWVLNTEDDFDSAFALKVDGIMTDFPTLLTKYLNRKTTLKKPEINC